MERISHMDMTKPAIEMREIVKKFGDFTANDHVNLLVHKGEVHAILGENGAGKSTLMNVLYGLYQPTSGQIFVGGKEEVIHSPSRAIELGIGMVHQHFMLVQPFSVTENIILGMEPMKGLTVDLKTARKRVEEISKRYNMQVDPDAKIEDISVGMQQRVEILKVLYRGADILILDEPTASLTPQEITELMEIISNLTADGKSVILITHKLKEITSCADYCTIIRQGKYIDTVKVSDVNENDLAAMMVGRKVEFKVEKKDIKPGEVVLEVKDIHGDKQFFLNGKRIVLRTAISWSFWPDNGITPSDELARRQVESAKKLGLNMLNFHRTIGHSNVLDYADELGLLYFEEPGGNQYPISHFNDNNKQSKFYFAYRNEKLARMIKRDRNHPSLVIYNLHNERGAWPQVQDYAQMRMAHSLDPTRILTYNSSNGENPENEANARFKLHLMPNDTTFYDYGWYDRHHAGGPGCYHDNLYLGKDNYHRFSDHKDEIIYWGEDGAIGTPPRLQLIRDEILQSGTTSGWEAMDYMKWYDAYDSFLKHNGFAKAFPTVDDLTRAMGNVAFYYQGRVIENIRISNTVDAYAVNGWESMKLENHSGIVDNYRYPKGDVEVMARYNQPLFLAVKMNRKVLNVGDTTIVDTYIVNEKNLKGNYSLQLIAKDAEGTVLATHVSSVHVKGGNVYGQCLQIGWNFVPRATGYVCIEAKLVKGKKTFATGNDSLFAVSLNTKGITANGSIADTTGVLSNFMKTVGFDIPEYKEGTPSGDYLLVGAFEPTQWGSGMSDIMEWVYKGHTLIIVDNAERWAEFLADKEVLDYRGSKKLGTAWYGGNFFNREHPIFDGLPVNCVFNWEYQCFATYNRHRVGLRCFNGETLVACVSDHKKEVYSALSVIPAGRGKIIITTLDIPACIKDVKAYTVPVDLDGMNESMNTFNTKSENRANVVGQQLLLNLIKESNR